MVYDPVAVTLSPATGFVGLTVMPAASACPGASTPSSRTTKAHAVVADLAARKAGNPGIQQFSHSCAPVRARENLHNLTAGSVDQTDPEHHYLVTQGPTPPTRWIR